MITAEAVSKSFFAETVLRPLSLTVKRGEVLGIVGPGGCGKTLVLKMLCGLVVPDSGRVMVDGVDLRQLRGLELAKMRGRFGVLFQNYALFDFMTVAENVAFPLVQSGAVAQDEARNQAMTLLGQLGLSGSEDLMPNELSGGMKKRVSLARATIARPEILLCDDPTAGLDPVTSSKIFIMLKRLQEETQATTVVISHDVDRMVKICDRYMMIFEGEVIFDGDHQAALASEHPVVKKFFVG